MLRFLQVEVSNVIEFTNEAACDNDWLRFLQVEVSNVIEFINEAACDNDFAKDNWIGKGGRGSPRENRDLELQNVLN